MLRFVVFMTGCSSPERHAAIRSTTRQNNAGHLIVYQPSSPAAGWRAGPPELSTMLIVESIALVHRDLVARRQRTGGVQQNHQAIGACGGTGAAVGRPAEFDIVGMPVNSTPRLPPHSLL